MAEEKSVTPERQLLKLIEEPQAKSSLGAATVKHHTLNLFSLDALKARFAFLKSRWSGNFKEGVAGELNIKLVNTALRLCVLILASYLIINTANSLMHYKEGINLELKLDKGIKEQITLATSLLKAAPYYLEKARERNIFKIGMKGTEDKLAKTPSVRITEATQNLKLVGISWSDDPDVMIEDTKSQRTYFLKKGQMLEGSIKLEAVFKDKVILSYAGEEIELK